MPDYIDALEISGLHIEIHTDAPLQITEAFLPFQSSFEKVDILARIRQTKQLPCIKGKRVYGSDSYAWIDTGDGLVCVYLDEEKDQRVYAVRQKMDAHHVMIQYLPGYEKYFFQDQNTFFHLRFPDMICAFGRMILHASLIQSAYGGLLFAGPSGIGKSTQADLWCRYEKAELLNGDKPVLAKDDTGSWLAYGSPYAGSSRAYVNACVPVRAVIMLKQGGVNEIRRFNTPQAFRHLYENLIVNVWDQGFVQMVCDMLTDLVMKVPVYELVCTPDVRAVQVVKYTLEGGGMNGIGSSKA